MSPADLAPSSGSGSPHVLRLFRFPRDAKIASSEHMRIGGSEDMAWLQICEPSEKDKGKYTFEIFDGKDNHQRSLDLSGQGEGRVPGVLVWGLWGAADHAEREVVGAVASLAEAARRLSVHWASGYVRRTHERGP